MKYKQSKKQNQRIQQVTEVILVVGADIAKKTHVARAVDFCGIELRILLEQYELFLRQLEVIMMQMEQCLHKFQAQKKC